MSDGVISWWLHVPFPEENAGLRAGEHLGEDVDVSMDDKQSSTATVAEYSAVRNGSSVYAMSLRFGLG